MCHLRSGGLPIKCMCRPDSKVIIPVLNFLEKPRQHPLDCVKTAVTFRTTTSATNGQLGEATRGFRVGPTVALTERTCVVKTMPHLKIQNLDGHSRRPGDAAAVLVPIAIMASVALAACGSASALQSAGQNVTAGIAAQKAGDYGTATTDYEKALKAEPKDVYALYDLGDVEQYQHQDTAAAEHYQEALAVNPHYEYALYNLAILDSASDPAAAKALYLEVIQLYPARRCRPLQPREGGAPPPRAAGGRRRDQPRGQHRAQPQEASTAKLVGLGLLTGVTVELRVWRGASSPARRFASRFHPASSGADRVERTMRCH